MVKALTPSEHFAKMMGRITVTSSGCWEWQGPRFHQGYGKTGAPGPGGSRYAHRVMYEYLIGAIPEGLVLDHVRCANKPCINPLHMEPVTSRENTLRAGSAPALNAAREVCQRGHPLSGDNLYLKPGQTSGRGQCRACRALSHQRYKKKL